MTKAEQNIEIAKILGFEFLEDKLGQVIYPDNWKEEEKVMPVTTIPDFVKMLEDVRKIAAMYKYGIPTQFIVKRNCDNI